MRNRVEGLAAPLVLGALALVCFARLVADPGALLVDSDRPSLEDTHRADAPTVGNDLTRLFLPHHLRIAEEIGRLGRLPMWDAFGFGGRPRAGNPQAGLWYPPVWLAWWSGSPAALGWLTVAHLLWGGLGTFGLCRTFGIGRGAALVAAGCFQASPYLLAQTFEGHYPHVWAASWYPWAFGSMALARRGDRRGLMALPAILALSLLAGHPQEGFYLAFALGLWWAADAVAVLRRGEGRSILASVAAAAGVGVLTLGLAAVEWMPDREAGSWALRSGQLGMKQASHYHLSPINLLQLFSPAALGGPADYVGHDNYWETVLSIGWVPLILVILAWSRSPRRDLVRGWGMLTALAIVFAAGRRLGLFALCYELVPGMGQFRVPARSLFLTSLGAAVLAGLGAEAMAIEVGGLAGDWRAAERRNRRWLLLLVTVLLAGLVASWWLDVEVALREGMGTADDAPRWPASNRGREAIRWVVAASRIALDPVFWAALGGSTLAIMWARRTPGDRHRVAIALGVLAFAELGANGHRLLRTAPPDRFLGPDPVSAAIARARPPGPFRIRARDEFYGDLRAAWHGFDKTNINDYFQIQHAADLYQGLYRIFDDEVDPARRALRQGVLDRMGVALLVNDRPIPESPWPLIASGGWEQAAFAIHANPTAMPRAYVIPRVERVPEKSATIREFGTTDPRQSVLMPAADPLGEVEERQPFQPAEYDATDPDRVRIRVETLAAGLLVVADTWMPGWTAQVDGRAAPILRGNHAQRVIPLPLPGRHVVIMTYRAPGLMAGLGLSGLSCSIWLVGFTVSLVGRSPRIGRQDLMLRGPIRRSLESRAAPSMEC